MTTTFAILFFFVCTGNNDTGRLYLLLVNGIVGKRKTKDIRKIFFFSCSEFLGFEILHYENSLQKIVELTTFCKKLTTKISLQFTKSHYNLQKFTTKKLTTFFQTSLHFEENSLL